MSLKMKLAAAALLPLSIMACSQSPEEARQEAEEAAAYQAELSEFNVKAIELPEALYDWSRTKNGAYEITVETSDGKKDCIANVITTTHGYKNVILTNCH